MTLADLRGVNSVGVCQNLLHTMSDVFDKPPQSGWVEGTGGGKGTWAFIWDEEGD